MENWFEHHQFLATMCVLFLGNLVSPSIQQLISFIRSIPRGWAAVLSAQRRGRLYHLEQYVADPSLLMRLIVSRASINTFAFGAMGLWSESRMMHTAGQHDGAIVFYARLLGAVELMLTSLMGGLVVVSSTTMLILWVYRDPQRRIERLKTLLPDG